jgi:hypothetical protein
MSSTSDRTAASQPLSSPNAVQGQASVSRDSKFHNNGEDSHVVRVGSARVDSPTGFHHIVRDWDVRDKRREVSPSFQQNTVSCLCPAPCTDTLNGKTCQRAITTDPSKKSAQTTIINDDDLDLDAVGYVETHQRETLPPRKENMDSSRKPARQTQIINGLDATSHAQGRRRNALPKKSAASASAPKTAGRSAPKNTGLSAPKTAVPSVPKNVCPPKPKQTRKPAATQRPVERFYEQNGLKIPLYEKSGKIRKQARLSSSLRNKNTDFLLDAVEQIAGAAKRRQCKDADWSKLDMAEWIEAVETRALGAHPHSMLDQAKLGLAYTKEELKTRATRAQPRSNMDGLEIIDFDGDDSDTPEDMHYSQPKDVKGKEEVDGRDMSLDDFFDEWDTPGPSSPPNGVKGKEDGKAPRIVPKQPTSLLDSTQSDVLTRPSSAPTNHIGKRKHDNTPEPAEGSQQTPKKLKTRHTETKEHTPTKGKRKHDGTPEPAQTPRQTPRKVKTHHAEDHANEQSSPYHIHTTPKAPNSHRKVRFEEPMAVPEEPEKVPILFPTVSPKKVDTKREQAFHEEQLLSFMADIKMALENPDTSTKVVRLPEQRSVRIFTASTNARTGKPILHDTPIAFGAGSQAPSLPPPPFLKPGTHGRHGDFEHDRDRITSRSHDISRKDQVDLCAYLSYRGQVFKKYPNFPKVGHQFEGFDEIKQTLEGGETWHNRFIERYPGYYVGHLWPCGCEKMKGEDEEEWSEEE